MAEQTLERPQERKLKDIYPLTPVQEGMLFHHLYDPESGMYVEQLTVDIRGEIDIPLFFAAVGKVVNRHGILKSGYQWEDLKKPMQVELASVEVPTELVDMRSEKENRELATNRYAREQREAGFHLAKAPLIRVGILDFGGKDYHLVWTFHHLILDGWSLGISLGEIFALYDEARIGKPARLSPSVPFKNHILWMKNQKEEAAREYWKSYLQGLERPTLLFEGQSFPTESDPLRTRTVKFSRRDTEAFSAFASSCRVTVNTLLQCILGVVISSATRERDVLFGSTVNGRPVDLKGFESMIGMFINTIPCRIQVDPDESIAHLAGRVQKEQSVQKPYEYYSLAEIRKLSSLSPQDSFFDVILVFENYPMDESAFSRDDFQMSNLKTSERTNYPLTIVASKSDTLNLTFFSDARHVREEVLDYIVSGFRNSVSRLRNPDAPVETLELIDPETQYRILGSFNATDIPFDTKRTLVDLFEERVAATPDRMAISDGERSLSYLEFDREANRLAHILVKQGVERERMVAVCAGRSIEMVIALYAILKAGGAYLPVDPAYPEDRVAFLLEDSDALCVLADGSGRTKLPAGCSVISIEDLSQIEGWEELPAEAPERDLHPNDMAYSIYTSGSTGTPKGVMIEHRGVVNLLTHMQRTYPLNEDDAYLLKTTFTFDVSVSELFGWFFSGGRLEILEQGGERDPSVIARTLSERGITHVNFVPSMLGLFLEHLTERGEEGRSLLNGLKYLMIAGEALTPDLIERCNRFQKNFQIANIYGPTEATIYAAEELIPVGQVPSPVPIGRPVSNAKAYIVDSDGRLLPPYVPGELCVGGAGVARGYLNRPELTEEKFIDNPFLPETRMYRTGDLASFRSDGRIDYLGRIDFQVKVRGFRIELGEIEAVLRKHEGVSDAVVVALREKGGSSSLCAYYASEKELSVSHWRSFLGNHLPDYMIPSFFVQLTKLPYTSSGKVDRKSLPSPRTEGEAKADSVPPAGETEQTIASIWSEILSREEIGATENFFEIGGDSLKAIKIVSKLKSSGLSVEIKDLFSYQSIRALAEWIDRGVSRNTETPFTEIEESLLEKTGGHTRMLRYATPEGEFLVLHVLSGDREYIEEIKGHLATGFSANSFPHFITFVESLPEMQKEAVEIGTDDLERLLAKRTHDPDLTRVHQEMARSEERMRSFVETAPVIDSFEISPIQYMQHRLPLRASGSILKIDGFTVLNRIESTLLEFVNQHGQMRARLARKGLNLFWKEYGPLDALDLPTLDLSDRSDEVQKRVVRELVNEYFKKPHRLSWNFAYRFLLIRLNLREAYLVFPADHMVYERRCEDILSTHIASSGAEGGRVTELPPSYGDYVRSIYAGPKITADQLIERYNFREFGDYRLELEKRIKKMRNKEANVRVQTIQFDAPVTEEEAWKASFLFVVHFLKNALGMEKIPLKALMGARVVDGTNYFNTFGEFVDAVPLLVDAKTDDTKGMLASYQELVDRLSEDNLNILSILLSWRFRGRYKKALRYILPKLLGLYDSLLLFNFSGLTNPHVEEFLEKENYKKVVADLIKSASIYCGAGYSGDQVTITIYSSIPFDEAKLAESAKWVRELQN